MTAFHSYQLVLGPVCVQVQTNAEVVKKSLEMHYQQLHTDQPVFIDFCIVITQSGNNLNAVIDNSVVFNRIPLEHAALALEWSINHCVYQNLHHYLIFHAATLVKEGQAVIIPAQSGTGKSTLSAALMLSGWTLLSDELTIMHEYPPRVVHLPKPINLKNDSIELIRQDFPAAQFGDWIRNTEKGDIRLLKLAHQDTDVLNQSYPPAVILTLTRERGVEPLLEENAATPTFQTLIDNAVNYNIKAAQGFKDLCWLTENCLSLNLTYWDLKPAVAKINEIFSD